MITKNGLIGKYLIAVAERNALEEGTLTEEETAGAGFMKQAIIHEKNLMIC